MLHRLTAIIIVIFWFCMTGLLVVREMYPELTRLNDVPVGYVTRLIFQHEQASDLELFEGPRDIGNLHLQPRHNHENGDLTLEYHGALAVDIPGGPHQRLSWVGTLEMDAHFHVKQVQAKIGFQQGAGQIDLLIEPPHNIARFSVKNGNLPAEESQLSLDEAGLTTLLAHAGLGPMSLAQLKTAGAQFAMPEVNAQTSSLQMNGESVSTFLFTGKMEGQTVIEAHLSQLGQLLRGQIPVLGYRFAPQNLSQ
jgi:hypothetical protein